jgi:microcystin-dependent protein
MDPTLANITIFAGNFAPLSWMFCQGQLMSIAENTALFSLIGTTYGGDGQTTFALPDFRSRVAIHAGQAAGMANYDLGEVGGSESVTLTSLQMPIHNHTLLTATGNPTATNAGGGTDNAQNAYPAMATGSSNYNNSDSGISLGASSCVAITQIAGGSQPIPIISPYLALNYIIAIEGIYPSRN